MILEEMECLKAEGEIGTSELSCDGEEWVSRDVNHISTLISKDRGYAWIKEIHSL